MLFITCNIVDIFPTNNLLIGVLRGSLRKKEHLKRSFLIANIKDVSIASGAIGWLRSLIHGRETFSAGAVQGNAGVVYFDVVKG